MRSQIRSFVAVEISTQVRTEIDRFLRRETVGIDGVKWVVPEQFHLTLKFLGDVPMSALHHVIRAVDLAGRNVEPFDLVFEGLGAFPNEENPKTLWVAVTEGVEEIAALAERVNVELGKVGYPVDHQRFTPHLTIGRVRSSRDSGRSRDRFRPGFRPDFRKETEEKRAPGPDSMEKIAGLLEKNKNRFFGISTIDAITLFSSELSRSGPKYEVLAETELKAVH